MDLAFFSAKAQMCRFLPLLTDCLCVGGSCGDAGTESIVHIVNIAKLHPFEASGKCSVSFMPGRSCPSMSGNSQTKPVR